MFLLNIFLMNIRNTTNIVMIRCSFGSSNSMRFCFAASNTWKLMTLTFGYRFKIFISITTWTSNVIFFDCRFVRSWSSSSHFLFHIFFHSICGKNSIVVSTRIYRLWLWNTNRNFDSIFTRPVLNTSTFFRVTCLLARTCTLIFKSICVIGFCNVFAFAVT